MIEFFGVSKEYIKGVYALKEISFEIKKGDFVFLTGFSGAGKSTLLKLIYKEEKVSSGQILIDSQNINLIPDKELYNLRRKIGVVFQDFKLLGNRTIFDNVAIPLYVRGEKKSKIDSLVKKTLQQVGLSHRMRYLAKHVSGGEQQRVAIARALVGQPKIIIADEPTGNLDTELSLEIMELFRKFNANGMTMLIATHDKGIIERFNNPIIRLQEGKLISYEGRIYA